MKKILVGIGVLLLLMQLVHVVPIYAGEVPPEQENWRWEPYGPRVDEYLYTIITDYDAELMAFKAGEIDTAGIEAERLEEVKDDPNIYILSYQTFNLQLLGINTMQYPWNYTAIRKAVAHLIDREWIIREVFQGFGYPTESPIPPAFGAWSNPNVKTYPYSKELAKQVLLEAGFTYDEAENKWYDPNGNELPIFYIQVPPAEQAPWLFNEVKHIVDDAKSIGLPLEIEAIEFQALVSQIYAKTFKSFILYLIWGRIPTLAYELFRTDGSWNFWGISDPEVDEYLEKFYYTANTTEAQYWLWKAQEKVSELLPYIPIYMGRANVGFRTDIAGVVLSQPVGGQHYFTLLDMHRIQKPFGGRFREALGSDPRVLNPFTALTADEWQVLGMVYENLFIANPDEVSSDYPWLAEKWTIEEVDIDGSKGTKITFYLAKNVTWHDGMPFTAHDVNFTFWFIKEKQPTQLYAKAFESMVKTEVTDDYTIAVYINGTSWAYFYDFNVPIIPMHIWGNTTLLEEHGGWEAWDPSKVDHPTVPGLTCLVGTGPFIFKERHLGEYILLTWNTQYWKRHPEKSLTVTLSKYDEVLYSGDKLSVELTLTDYLGNPVTNATVTIELVRDSEVVKSVTATHAGDGVYVAEIDTGGLEGDFDLRVSAVQQISLGELSRTVGVSVTVLPVWQRYLPYIGAGIAVVIVAVIAVVLLRRRA
ncbi:MAG: ABC transporter substrate-binding protein [archaeon GB-1867-005]|nr:ABC transporter substrate-binding protein [Candidatus Culexmicrobium cathedralense]